VILVNSQEERKSLTTEPLPISNLANMVLIDYTAVGPDRVLTSIVLIDEQVDQIQQILQPVILNLMKQREGLLARAINESITGDMGAVLLEKKGKLNRNEIEDLDAFELQFPGKLQAIRTEQERVLTMKYEKEKKAIPESDVKLGVADSIVGKDEITEFVGHKPVSISYEVVRKGGN